MGNNMSRMHEIPDETRLVSSIRKGDHEAFETVYIAYSGMLMKYAGMIVKNRDAAYEVVQDTFVSVWMNRKKLDPSKPVRNYLLRAVHNNSLKYVRKEMSRHSTEQKAASAERIVISSLEQDNSPKYDIEGLIPAVDRLPEQSRRIFKMSYWEDMKSMDIASELSISVRTVESILYKARKRLREELKLG